MCSKIKAKHIWFLGVSIFLVFRFLINTDIDVNGLVVSALC